MCYEMIGKKEQQENKGKLEKGRWEKGGDRRREVGSGGDRHARGGDKYGGNDGQYLQKENRKL
jgi:hypothetical protein